MKIIPAMACAAIVANAPHALAGEYISIVQETTANAPAAPTWERIKGFCAIGAWLKTSCEIVGGKDGEPGAVRRLAGNVDEVLVSQTPLSYTYVDPNQPILYHGALEVRPVDGQTSKIIYSVFYDQATLKPQDRAAARDGRLATFAGVLATLKGIAEAPIAPAP